MADYEVEDGIEVPDFDNTREFGQTLPPDEWFDVSLVEFYYGKSKNKGTPGFMMQMIVDNGMYAGSQVRDNFWIGGNAMGWEQLKSLCIAAGFKWKKNPDLKTFAEQFVDLDTPLRFAILTKVEYSYKKTNGSTEYNVSKEDYEKAKEQNVDAYANVKVANWRAAQKPPEITLQTKFRQNADGAPDFDDTSSAGAPSGGSKPDDDLPF